MGWRSQLKRVRGDVAARRAAERAADRVIAEVGGRVDAVLRRLDAAVGGRSPVPPDDVPAEELARLWSGSAEDETVRRHSHWRGAGRISDEAWLGIGRRTRGYVEELLEEHGDGQPSTGGHRILEWGPGGGSNLVALASLAQVYVGVDISAPNLEECGRQATACGLDGFVPVHLQGPPADVVAQVGSPVDVIVCTSVFQHFPSIAYGEQVLEAMRALSRPGTLGVIQVRYAEREDRPPATGRYEDDYIHGSVHPLPDFWWALDRAGFTPLRIVDLEPVTNYAWFLLRVTP